MCLALLGPGDTALVPAPSFPIHIHAIALASANVISLDVRDSSAFLANIARTCESLYPRPKILVLNYPHNPTATVVEPAFFEEIVALAQEVPLLRDPRLRLRRHRLRRLSAAELPVGEGGQGGRLRVHDDVQGLQHGRLAGRLRGRQPRHAGGARRRSRAITTTGSSRPCRSPRSSRCGTARRGGWPRSPSTRSRRDALVAA